MDPLGYTPLSLSDTAQIGPRTVSVPQTTPSPQATALPETPSTALPAAPPWAEAWPWAEPLIAVVGRLDAAEMQVTALRDQVAALAGRVDLSEHHANARAGQVAALTTQIEQQHAQVLQLTTNQQTLVQAHRDLQSYVETVEVRLTQSTARGQTLEAEVGRLLHSHTVLTQDHDRLAGQLALATAAGMATDAKLRDLEALIASRTWKGRWQRFVQWFLTVDRD